MPEPTTKQSDAAPDKGAHVLAISSGKGGVGKSNIAVNLGIALVQRGRRVIILDMDLGLANDDILLDLHAEKNLSDVINGRNPIEEVIIDAPGGLLLLPGASGDEQLANLDTKQREKLVEAIEGLEGQADYLIIDTGAGIAENSLAIAAAADDVLMVTTPEPTAMLDAYAAIKLLHQRSSEHHIHLLVNMARNPREARQTILRLSSISEGFIGEHLVRDGVIPYHPAVGEAVRHRKPLMLATPESPAARAISRIAERLDCRPFDHHQHHTQNGFIHRLLGMLGV